MASDRTAEPMPVPYNPESPLSEEMLETLLSTIGEKEKTVRALLPDESADERRKRMARRLRELTRSRRESNEEPSVPGLVVGVKDLFHTADFPTRGGSRLPAEAFTAAGAPGHPGDGRDGGVRNSPSSSGAPDADQAAGSRAGDAEAVARLRRAGAILLGKTVSTEFAYFAPGPTTNPLNPHHTPGGSSSGSAAAVAAGYCHLALGTQTIGSISRPATFCGVTGYKPSFGRISDRGVIPFSPSADHVGIIAADVATATRGAEVLADRWNGDEADISAVKEVLAAAARAKPAQQGISAVPPGLGDIVRRHIGTVLIPDDAYLAQADGYGRAGLESVIERLVGLGVHVTRVSIMDDIEAINGAHQEMIAREFAEVHRFWLPDYGSLYHERSQALIKRGEDVPDERYATAVAGREELRRRLDRALDRHGASVWIAPATVGEAPEGIDATGNPIMNLPWTYAGVPTVSLPVHHLPHGRGAAGLPLGVQIAGMFGRDERLFYCAALLEGVFR